MSVPADRDRRLPLPALTSGPDVFGRPMDPAPAPLVYINGWHGIGKETVAECLTLLLGRDKSLLIDVRSVGHDEAPASGGSHTSGTTKHPHQHHPRHRPDRSPLLTPEHPRYFSFDDGLRAGAAAEPEAETEAEADPDSGPPSPSMTTATTSPAQSPPASRSASASNLAALLSRPANHPRIAVLPACCPDTPSGRAALRTFQSAAERAGRRFVGIMLEGSGQQGCYGGWQGGRLRGGSDGFFAGSAGAGVVDGDGRGDGVDVGSVPAFEAALLIVGFVRGLEAEGRCGKGGARGGEDVVGAGAEGGDAAATGVAARGGTATPVGCGSAAGAGSLSATTEAGGEGKQKSEVVGGE
ncbi:hypothetical protein C8A05DRAFT_12338 [Staphylotrichum tortipilum]|uniref:Uncharacterized protein n=1 Tax=Staphylotrichum tortipilum TaxID=2831512 RepID=A0AAN6MSY1_9PEZI|nr:hypothetical protein C8A05DRAFT_12338 [Staphylotrichum longicolle]